MRTIAENYELPYYTMSPTYSICAEHGYLSGEQYVCPHCGAKTEVYSRITGYYRPVQNWNEGKTQEFKERKLYVVGDATKLPNTCRVKAVQEETADTCGLSDGVYLFTTKTCPNCKLVKRYLEIVGMAYEEIDAEEQAQLAVDLGIRQAPTLVVTQEGQMQRFDGAGEIKQFLDNVSRSLRA